MGRHGESGYTYKGFDNFRLILVIGMDVHNTVLYSSSSITRARPRLQYNERESACDKRQAPPTPSRMHVGHSEAGASSSHALLY